MAIDPATAKAIITIAKQILTDKKTRQRVLIILSIPLIAILIIISSPFAILFGTTGESVDDKGKPVTKVMQELKSEFQDKISKEQNTGSDINQVKVIYMGSEGEAIDNSGHVLALFSIINSMADNENVQQVASLTKKQVKELKKLYWSMNSIRIKIVSIPWDENISEKVTPTLIINNGTTPSPMPSPTPTPKPYRIKYIYITCLSYEDMIDKYDLNDEQLAVLDEMMTGRYAYLFESISGNSAELTPQEIAEILSNLPIGLSIEREDIVLTSYSLVGKVKYFWGGKSNAVGWDNRWGQIKKVTSPGSKSTGTYRPFGLDCSGYVKWVYRNSGFPASVINNHFGSGSSVQWKNSIPIKSKDVMPGDLSFRCVPGTATNHVGIVVGYNTKGKLMVAHCSSSSNGIVVTPFSPTFKYLMRPIILIESSK